MAGVDTQIAELNVEIAKYKKQLTDLEADFEEAEPRDEEGIKNDIRRKEDAIIETRKTVNLLLQQQTVQAHPGSIEMHKLFKPKNGEYQFIIQNLHNSLSFQANCCIDTGSSFECILPRRKIGQLGLCCLNNPAEEANCGSGKVWLYQYEAVAITIPALGRMANLRVFGVHPTEVKAAFSAYKPNLKKSHCEHKERKEQNSIKQSPGEHSSSSSSSSACSSTQKRKRKNEDVSDASSSSSSSTSSSLTSPQRRSSRKSCALSPCSLNREATNDAEVLIGLPGLEQLNLVIDFKGGCIRVSKSPKVVRLRTR